MTVSDIEPDWPEALASREEIERVCFRNLLGARDERVFFKDLDGRFVLVSAGWLAAEGHGCSLEEVIGRTDFDIFSERHAVAALEDEQRIIQTGEPMIARIERETFDDHPDVWVSTTKLPLLDERGRIMGTFGIARDVTAQMHDSVTGLANRVALIDRLTQALLALERTPGRVGLLFLDIDAFKNINDTLGHHAGDRVLVDVGKRLTRVARRFDTAVRYGGDEFVLLCTALQHGDDLRLIGERVLRAIRAQLVEGHREPKITVSLGAAVTSAASADPDELLQQADTAMYAAKRAGGDRFQIYNAQLHR